MITVGSDQVELEIGTRVQFRLPGDWYWHTGTVRWGGKSGLRIRPDGGGKVHHVEYLNTPTLRMKAASAA